MLNLREKNKMNIEAFVQQQKEDRVELAGQLWKLCLTLYSMQRVLTYALVYYRTLEAVAVAVQ
jgi:hypothetical protein